MKSPALVNIPCPFLDKTNYTNFPRHRHYVPVGRPCSCIIHMYQNIRSDQLFQMTVNVGVFFRSGHLSFRTLRYEGTCSTLDPIAVIFLTKSLIYKYNKYVMFDSPLPTPPSSISSGSLALPIERFTRIMVSILPSPCPINPSAFSSFRNVSQTTLHRFTFTYYGT